MLFILVENRRPKEAKSSDDFVSHSRGELDQNADGRGDCEGRVVAQHNVKVAQPLDLAKAAEEVEVRDTEDLREQRKRRAKDDEEAAVEDDLGQ